MCLPSSRQPVCLPPEINHTPAWPPKSKSTKKKKAEKKGKNKNETENKAGKVCNAIFFIDFQFVSRALLVCEWVCMCARVSMSGWLRVRLKCAEWHIVFQSVGSADR